MWRRHQVQPRAPVQALLPPHQAWPSAALKEPSHSQVSGYSMTAQIEPAPHQLSLRNPVQSVL